MCPLSSFITCDVYHDFDRKVAVVFDIFPNGIGHGISLIGIAASMRVDLKNKLVVVVLGQNEYPLHRRICHVTSQWGGGAICFGDKLQVFLCII